MTPHGEYVIPGHAESSEFVLERYREHLEAEAKRIAAQLADLDEGLGTVYHRTGSGKSLKEHELLDDYGPGPWLSGGGVS